jgi:hypothetical protein
MKKKPVLLRIAAGIMAASYMAGLAVRDAMFAHLHKNGMILGANSFNKEERVAFDQVFEKFEDGLVLSNLFGKYTLDPVMAERTGNTIWRPQPYIAQSFTGIDQSANFARNYTQLSVPSTLGYSHSVPLTLSATELRDQLQAKRLGDAAMQRLASDINVDCSNLASLSGTVVVKRTGAAAGFDDVAAIDTAFNRMGIPMHGRKACFSSGDYNSMASNLAQRTLDNSKSLTAYERAAVGNIAGFDVFKLDYAYRLAAAAGTTVTVNGANQYYTPKATSTAGTGETSNVDNRYQTLTIGVTAGTVKVGDAFTIAGVNEVHHITKQDTGSLKTFRITGIVSGGGGAGVVQISPPIISATGGTDAEKQYQNVTAAPANGAAITFCNTAAAAANPFWQEDAFEIIPGKYQPQEDAGLAIMSATTENGVTVVMTRQGAIGDLSTKYRWDVFYGLVNKQPEMTGIELFSQP